MADTWHIIPGGQRQSTVLSQNGTGFTDIIEITYQIDSGPAASNTFTVKVPAALYNADYVKAVIDADVMLHSAVAGL